MITIYIDVLLVLNIYVNYFLLCMTARLTHSPLKTFRCAAAAVYGSLFSLLILLPPLGTLLNTVIKLLSAVSITAAAFGFYSWYRLMMNSAAFFVSNLMLAGAVYALDAHFPSDMMLVENSSVYIDFSLAALVVSTAAVYAAVRIMRTIADKAADGCGLYSITVRWNDRIFMLNGIADTGNTLVDLFTGVPVIVCDDSVFGKFDISALPKGVRLIPCSTISKNGVIPVFRPDEVIIDDVSKGRKVPVNAMIGLAGSSGKAIFNPRLLS